MRTAAKIVRAVAALLLLGAGLFVASVAASNGPRAHANPAGELSPPASGSFTIVTLSDLKARSGVLLRAYDDARTNGADAIVVGGDLVMQSSDLDYRYANRLLSLAPAGVPVFVTIGNHELWSRSGEGTPERFERFFGPTQSWFRTKGVLFVALDTADYHFPQARADAARAILRAERPRSRACVLLSHILPQKKQGAEKALDAEDSARILALVDDFDVGLLLGGHYHGYAESKHGRATILLTGGGGANLDGPDEFYHYLRVTLAPDGSVTHQVIKVDSPHGIEWLRYQLLRYSIFVLAALAAVLVAATLVVRRAKRPEAKAP